MSRLSIAAPFVVNMLEGAKNKGHDISELAIEAGMPADILPSQRARVSFEQLSRLNNLLASLLDDEGYGLTSKPQRQGTFKLACYSAIHAETIEQAIQVFVEFYNLMELDFVHKLHYGQDQVNYQICRRPDARICNSYIIEYTLLVIHRTLCWMANTRIPLLKVDLDYPKPDYSDEYAYVFYGAPLLFNQPSNALYFSKEILKLYIVRYFSNLLAFLKQAPLNLLSQGIQADYLSSHISRWLEISLARHHELPNVSKASARFGLHPQTLKNKLKVAGTSYQQLKMDVRQAMAMQLIADPNLSVEAIAFQLGFSEPSAFIRAFKAWTGLTPLAYRKQNF
jgi:AraC-like DNA-binding protein